MSHKWQFLLPRRSPVLWMALGLIVLNAALIFPLFRGGYTPYVDSGESTYLSGARFLSENFSRAAWNPEWFLGFPFHQFYPPGLPYLVASLHTLFGLSLTSAYRVLTGLAYIGTPAALFLFVRYLTGRSYPAAISSVIYSLAPSFIYWLPSARAVGADFGYAPWPLVALLQQGEGPHLMALAFIPLAALGLQRALRHISRRNVLFTALMILAVALLDRIAFFALGIILFGVIFSELLVGFEWAKLRVILAWAFLTVTLYAFWLMPYLWPTSFTSEGSLQLLDLIRNSWLAIIFLTPPIVVAITIFFSGTEELQPWLVIGGWLAAFLIIVLAWSQAAIILAPQPSRYLLELNMAGAVILGLLVDWVYTRVPRRSEGWLKWLPLAYTSLVLGLFAFVSLPFLRLAHQITRPQPDIAATPEYQTAEWLAEHAQNSERVYATGRQAAWLNVFTHVPQLRGGLTDEGVTDAWWEQVSRQIDADSEGETTLLWAKALGLRYLVTNSSNATTLTGQFASAGFESQLPKVYDQQGIRIYEAPLESAGEIQVIEGTSPPPARLRDPADGDGLRRYLEWIGASSAVTGGRLAVRGSHLEFDVNLPNPQAMILVRATYHPAWQAFCNGRPVPVREDPIGLILIEPGQSGACHLVLQYHGLPEWLSAAMLLLIALGLSLGYLYAFHWQLTWREPASSPNVVAALASLPADKRLKIAVFHCSFIYSGGGERIVLEEVKGLRQRGHTVVCFAPTLNRANCYPDLIDEIGVQTFLPQLPKWFPLRDAIAMGLTSLLAPTFALRFREADVFVGANQPSAWIAYCLARLLRKPYVVYLNQPNRLIYPRAIDKETGWLTRRDYYVLNALIQRLKRFVAWADRKSFTGADVMLVNGDYMAGIITEIYGRLPVECPAGCHPQPLEQLNPAGAQADSFTIKEVTIRKPYVLLTNRHEPQKKFEYAIQAMAHVLPAVPQASLVIPGPFTSHTPSLIALAEQLGIAEHVLFLGPISEADLQHLYRDAAVYCYPAPEEDFGMGVIEAMAWGVPVVAWNHAGPTVTVVGGVTGYLAEPYEVESYAAGIRHLLLDPETRLKMGRAAHDRAEAQFSWERHVQILEEACQQALTRPKPEVSNYSASAPADKVLDFENASTDGHGINR
jgi:glycosyltransferase involved in cell wall biosynthesis